MIHFIQGAICWAAVCRIYQALSVKLGGPSGRAFLLVTALQFHLPFYMCRTLPNTFATALLGFAIGDWIDARHPRRVIALLAIAVVSSKHMFRLYGTLTQLTRWHPAIWAYCAGSHSTLA